MCLVHYITYIFRLGISVTRHKTLKVGLFNTSQTYRLQNFPCVIFWCTFPSSYCSEASQNSSETSIEMPLKSFQLFSQFLQRDFWKQQVTQYFHFRSSKSSSLPGIVSSWEITLEKEGEQSVNSCPESQTLAPPISGRGIFKRSKIAASRFFQGIFIR